MRSLTPVQKAWAAKATPAQLTAFMAAGRAEVPSMINLSTGAPVWRAALRGILLEEDTFDSYDEALAAAEAKKAQYLAEGHPPVDEDALGISDRNRDLMDVAEDATLRIERIIHIGTMASQGADAMAEPLADFIDELDGDLLKNDLKGLWPGVLKASARAKAETKGCDYHTRKMMQAEALFEVLHESGQVGWLVQVATPSTSNGSSFSWGSYHTRWVYAETYEAAIEKAAAWADAMWAAARKKAKAAASTPTSPTSEGGQADGSA